MEKRQRDMPFFCIEESKEQLSIPKKFKRKARPKKMEFDRWGSKPLIGFLESIGKETSKQLSQYEVTAIINEYVHGNNLLNPHKKKRIFCDARLYSLFGKKSVARIKIYDLLETHFTENHDDSEDELLYSSEEMEENFMVACKRHKTSSSDKKAPHQKKLVPETPKSCFAAIISENIKLVYLRRSVVQDLLKDPESFEGKVVGSYVRIKSDPNDYFQKNSHQLLQVTGVRKASGYGDVNTEIFVQVQNLIKDIQISMLSDDNFSEEECEDLREKVKAGLLKRHTVVELEQKAQILHEDITKHWLVRELGLLQNLIDRANEKGWRKELHEYLERKQLLQNPSEQSRMLHEVPKVIADEIEQEATPQDPVDILKHGDSCSPKSILRGASDISVDLQASQTLSTQKSDSAEAAEDHPADFVQQQKPTFVIRSNESDGEMQPLNSGENKDSQGMADQQIIAPEVIELSDDEQEAEDPGGQDQIVDHPESLIWYYLDPQGDLQGPFSMSALKRWNDACYFHPGFRVWKTGQSHDEAVLLTDLLPN